ncbi:hypothetical protein NDK47_14765 [Brevibacillus ruminantium]|uniref:DUF4830 domain-containing protein n=1 Tax=Brevibacillus ruminantium TaxID=2950604 RepID=A0ABY4W8E7_9BACL|nr:hypothetical protein [Brevibacillus ruminantium]USG63440.1 hypothetical protein NDK47_14765 [Brevibacillus ruminantium]
MRGNDSRRKTEQSAARRHAEQSDGQRQRRSGKPILWALAIILVMVLGNVTLSWAKSKQEASTDPLIQIAAQYLTEKGYVIEKSEGLVHSYTLTGEELASHQSVTWALQQVKPDIYLGKEILFYKFIVSNHPLDLESKTDEYEKTDIVVMLNGEEVIGGTSMPHSEELLYGGPYSLEGKTLEEVTGLAFQAWREQWESRYGKKEN